MSDSDPEKFRIGIRLTKKAHTQLMILSETLNMRPSAVIAQAIARAWADEPLVHGKTAKRAKAPTNGAESEE